MTTLRDEEILTVVTDDQRLEPAADTDADDTDADDTDADADADDTDADADDADSA
jgi:hypothetical protein